jgi:hypothetical protein
MRNVFRTSSGDWIAGANRAEFRGMRRSQVIELRVVAWPQIRKCLNR